MRKQKLYSGSGGICLNVFLRMVALVCCLIVTVGVQAYAQEQRTLTAEFKDTPLAEVLKKLEKLSSFIFGKYILKYNTGIRFYG